MRERLIALIGGVVSLLLVLMLLTPLGQPQPPKRSLPTSVDRGGAGLAAFEAWLSGQGVDTVSHRRPLTELPDGTGSLLIMSVPGLTGIADGGAAALRVWVEQGNHLLVLAAYGSHPDWREKAENNVETALSRLDPYLSGSHKVKAQEIDAPDDAVLSLEPLVDHPLTAGVEAVHVPAPAGAVHDLKPAPADAVSLALLGQDGRPAVWWLARGEGSVVLSAYAGLFSHAALAEADNARLAANLVNQMVSPAGQVLFDDFRFGLDERYDPEAFFADPRLHYTLAFIVGFWLLYVIGHGSRLAPSRPPARPSAPRQFAEGVAGLLARRVPRAELRERLWRNFLLDLHHRHGAGDPWAILASSPRLARADLAELRRLRSRSEAGRHVDDEHYARLLIRIRESTL